LSVTDTKGDLEVDDQRPTTPRRPFAFTGVLSSAQEEAVAELTRHDIGVLVAPTGPVAAGSSTW
jgi:superfamily II DNA or RNA helicase